MKVIIIGPAYPLRGGIADTNESFCRALLDKDVAASIVTFSLQYPNFLFPGQTQFSTDPKPSDLEIEVLINSINPLSWRKTANYINAQKPDLVIFRYWIPFMGMSLGSIARLLDKNIVKMALCDNVIPHENRLGDHSLTRYFTQAFDAFITMSRTVGDELNEFSDKPKIYIPHPINTNLGNKISKQKARQKLGLEKDGKYLLFFGLVRKYKGLDLLLQALGDAQLQDSDVNLIVAGEFYDPIETYEKIIQDFNLENRVIIHNKFIANADIPLYFSACDMVTLTYHTASQSGVSQIAMHFDCPILVTDVGGLSEIIPHQKIGYVCQKEPSDIAKWIADFYDKNRFETFSKNVEIEKQKYSWAAFSEEVLKLYQNIHKA